MIPVILPMVNASQHPGPALFQGIGLILVAVWGVWLMNRPSEWERQEKDRLQMENERLLKAKVRAHYEAEYQERTAPRPVKPKKQRDPDTVFLCIVACVAVALILLSGLLFL